MSIRAVLYLWYSFYICPSDPNWKCHHWCLVWATVLQIFDKIPTVFILCVCLVWGAVCTRTAVNFNPPTLSGSVSVQQSFMWSDLLHPRPEGHHSQLPGFMGKFIRRAHVRTERSCLLAQIRSDDHRRSNLLWHFLYKQQSKLGFFFHVAVNCPLLSITSHLFAVLVLVHGCVAT